MKRSAIITGADSGIGKATAVMLAGAGYDIGFTWYDDEAGARGTAEEVRAAGGRAQLRRVELEQLPAAADAVDELADALGGVHVLVNNAGTMASAPFLEHSFEDWRRVLSVDLDGAFLCAQRAARRMVRAGVAGRIVNVTSVHERVPLEGASAYCAAKGGLAMLTKVMALELAPHGITVNAVAPGEVSTPMTGQHEADAGEQPRPGIPMGRPADAREIASLIAYLVSPEASYSTGSSFVADGGLLLMAAVRNKV